MLISPLQQPAPRSKTDVGQANPLSNVVRLASLIRNHRDELALLETVDMGKPISDSTSIDVRYRKLF